MMLFLFVWIFGYLWVSVYICGYQWFFCSVTLESKMIFLLEASRGYLVVISWVSRCPWVVIIPF